MVSVALLIGFNAVQDLSEKQNPTLSAMTVSGIFMNPLAGDTLEKPRMIELVEEQCPICNRMSSRMDQLKKDCLDHLVDIHVVSLSDSQNRELKSKLNLRGVPTILLVDNQGTVLDTVVGERTLTELRGLAANLQSMTCGGIEPIFDIETLPQTPSCDSEDAIGELQCG